MPNVEYRGMNLMIPENDSEWREHFKLARGHKLMLRACRACGLMRYPPTHACPWCMALEWDWKEVSGKDIAHEERWAAHRLRDRLIARPPIPDLDRMVKAGRGQALAVWTEDDAGQGVGMPVKGESLLPGHRVPDLHGVVLTS